jgi:uncharacterized protein (DUF302 family)
VKPTAPVLIEGWAGMAHELPQHYEERRVMNKTTATVAKYETSYGYHKVLDLPWEITVQRAKEALAAEGFGVLCEIDMGQNLKENLILGACNPPLAYQALREEPDLGLLLPCNIVVYEHEREGSTVVSSIDADKIMSIVGNPRVEIVAKQVNDKLRRVIDNI